MTLLALFALGTVIGYALGRAAHHVKTGLALLDEK